MSISDPIGDMIARIRNGQMARKSSVKTPASRMRVGVLEALKEEGYIRGYEMTTNSLGHPEIKVELKYHEDEPVIQYIKRVSKPGRRFYSPIKELKPIYNGLGVNILSTSQGVMSEIKARQLGIGGEVVCSVY
jgi:small subunit ribosomal protein S8